MKSSFFIFLVGVVFGSTLGIGGLWTQVVVPAKDQIEELEQEHGLMEKALTEAEKTLSEVATTLRTDDAPVTGAEIIPGPMLPGPTQPQPVQPTARETTKPLQPTERKALADRLDTLAGKLGAVRGR